MSAPDVARDVAQRVGMGPRARVPRPVNVHDYAPPLSPEEFERQAARMEREQKGRGELADQARREQAEVRAALERIEREGHAQQLEQLADEDTRHHEVQALGAFRPEPGEVVMVREWRAWYRGAIAVDWLRKANTRSHNG